MSSQYSHDRNGSRPSGRRSHRTYSAESRRPVSRRARDRQSARGAADRRVAQEASAYSLNPDARDSEYQKYSRNAATSAHSARGKAHQFESDGHYVGQARKRRKRRRILTIVLSSLAVILVAGVAVAGGWLAKINGNLNSGIDSKLSALLSSSPAASQPSYFLILGTDESKARDNDASFGGTFRADTIILARVDPTTKKVALVSIPRDTRVDLGGDYGVQKINAASALGGASLAVQAVENLTGVDIDHYVQVNFDGFEGIVDSLGGIEVNVPIDINDSKAGGSLKKGKQTLNGKQALILCRSRHSYDSVGSGDIYRSANQRLVLTAIAKKMMGSDAATIANTVSTMSEYVTTDLGSTDILALAQAFQGFDTDSNMYTAQFPTTSQYMDDIWYEVADTDTWSSMKARMDAGESPAESSQVDSTTGTVLATTGDSSSSSGSSDSYSGKVVVLNGTATAGLASKAASAISNLGFTTGTDNAGSSDYTSTLVVYSDDKYQKGANAIVSALGCGTAVKNDGSYTVNGKFLVILGSDYSG